MKKPSPLGTLTVSSGFPVTIPHGAIMQTHDGRTLRVVHPWWRRLLHWVTFGRFKLHPSTTLQVTNG